MSISDETLIAYVDGEADADARAAVEAEAAANPDFAQRLARHRALRARVTSAFAGVVDEPVPQALIDRIANDGKVVSLAARRPAVGWTLALSGMAASLVVGVLVGGDFNSGPLGPGMSARGELAQALDAQLASADQSNQPVRIGVSFKATDGHYCRTFAVQGAEALAGVACREPKTWRVVAAATEDTSSSGAFRTAGSAPPSVMSVVDRLIAGDPLDAKAEQTARDRGWR